MKKEAELIALIATNFPDHAFLTEVCRVLGVLPGERVPSTNFKKITLLDVSNCGIHKLKGLAFFTGLKELYCAGNRLTCLDITCCPELETVSCGHNELSRLTVRGCPKLYTLICNNNCLCSLDLTGCDNLHELLCNNNMLRKLDSKVIDRLDMLWCHGNPVTSPDCSTACEHDVLPISSAC